MSHGRRARVMNIDRIKIAGIAGCAQALVLSLKQNNTQTSSIMLGAAVTMPTSWPVP